MARGRVIHKRGFLMNIRVLLTAVICTLMLTLGVYTRANANDSIETLLNEMHQQINSPVPDVAPEPTVELVKTNKTLTGRASYYGKNHHGRRTASGQRFNMWAMTAAHKTLPFGTCLAILNTKTDKTVIVRINDRGPYHGNRVLDLSQGAAAKIGMIKTGVATISYSQVTCPTGKKTKYI